MGNHTGCYWNVGDDLRYLNALTVFDHISSPETVKHCQRALWFRPAQCSVDQAHANV